MSIFNSILQKLGIQKPAVPAPAGLGTASAASGLGAAAAPVPTPAASVPSPATVEAPIAPSPVAPVAVPAAPVSEAPVVEPVAVANEVAAPPAAMPMVDVVSMLDNLAKSHPGADWKVSIADLLMMLGFEHSYEYRKQLAAELGCPADLMSDSARMNVWLHKTVLQKISENGGNIPSDLLA